MLAQKPRREERLVRGGFFFRRMLARGEHVLFFFLFGRFLCAFFLARGLCSYLHYSDRECMLHLDSEVKTVGITVARMPR